MQLQFVELDESYKRDIVAFFEKFERDVDKFEMKTSGSTGQPKLITIFKKQMQLSAAATIKELKLVSGNAAFVCLNTNFIAGKMMLVRCILANMKATIVMPDVFPFDLIDFEKNKFQFAAFVPYQLTQMFARGNEKDLLFLNDTRKIIVGGGPLTEELEANLKQLKSDVYHTFGMTETVSHFALRKINSNDTFYKIFEGVAITIDERGCLRVKSAVTGRQWLATNDLVELVYKQGKAIGFTWKGRIDNVIISGGVKISIEEVESYTGLVFQNLNIRNNYFIYKKPDELFTEKVVLYIELQAYEKVNAEEINAGLQKLVPNRYMLPKEVVFLPYFHFTSTGKIDRKKSAQIIPVIPGFL